MKKLYISVPFQTLIKVKRLLYGLGKALFRVQHLFIVVWVRVRVRVTMLFSVYLFG